MEIVPVERIRNQQRLAAAHNARPRPVALDGENKICACGNGNFRVHTIQSASHYWEHEIDSYHLCICDQCGANYIRHVWCEKYDQSGINDIDGHRFDPISAEELETLKRKLAEERS